MMLPSFDKKCKVIDTLERITVEADGDNIEDDSPLDPIFPVEKI